MYLACRSASSCQSRRQLTGTSPMLTNQEAHSSRTASMWPAQVAPEKLLENCRRGREAITISLLMCLWNTFLTPGRYGHLNQFPAIDHPNQTSTESRLGLQGRFVVLRERYSQQEGDVQGLVGSTLSRLDGR
jgi:hypothetical protein